MAFKDKLLQIDQLQGEIEERGKLGTEVLRKINYKFRLDWNYYSNRMEGNTLTLDETKSVMVGNINVHNKPLKDVMEMKGHDETIITILRMGKGELNITESRIKEIHRAIMYEENPGEKEKIGKWKSQANHVINYRNEKYDFADPYEVPEKMHDLVNWINAENERIRLGKKAAVHPVQLAFDFHLRYLTVHPFYDGNGRTGRILTNVILISYGYPPIYIKDSEKEVYYRYLADVQAYGSDKFMLFDVMADYLIRSLNVVADAIAGKEIDEPDDLDKKLQLLERELIGLDPDNEVRVKYSVQAFLDCYEGWIARLVTIVIPVIKKFDRFFASNSHYIAIPSGLVSVPISDKPILEVIKEVKEQIVLNKERIGGIEPEFMIYAQYKSLIRGGIKSFDCYNYIRIKFSAIKYEVWVEDFSEGLGMLRSVKIYERLLHQSLSDEEMNDIALVFGNGLFKEIDYQTKRNGIRKQD